MTDLETAIRDALNARADATPVRHTTLEARRRRRWLAPVLAAALVIALVAVTLVLLTRKDSTTPPASPKPTSFVGYRWRLAQIDDRQGTLTLPATTKASVSFGSGGQMLGNDTVHGLSAHYRVVVSGYVPSGVAETDNGLAGSISAAVKRTLGAIGSCFSPVAGNGKPPAVTPVRASVAGDRLVLHTSDGVLTLVRAGPATD